jgi:predicted metal-dependent hydrolase
MDHPSKMNVAETKRVISDAMDSLAQLQGSLFHTQRLIDSSIQQMQETQELLSRIGKTPDLFRDREQLQSGTGDRANAIAKHSEGSRP